MSITRRIDYYTINAQTTSGAISYTDFIQRLSAISPKNRRMYWGPFVLAIPRVDVDDSIVDLIVLRGDKDAEVLIYNEDTGEEELQILEQNQVLAEKTHLCLDAENKKAVCEYNRRGAKITEIAILLQYLGREFLNYTNLVVNFVPITDIEFEKAIARFERIREASVTITKPNPSWNDYEDQLLDYTKKSNGQKFSFSVNAIRGKTLNFNAGIIYTIKQLVRAQHTSLEAAKITGRRSNETSETSINTKKFQLHTRRNFRTDEHRRIDTDDVKVKLRNLIQ